MTSSTSLREEFYFVAEYASRCGESSLDFVQFVVTDGDRRGCSVVKVNEQEYVVDTAWCLGNLRRLPDCTTLDQMYSVLRASHPDVKGVGPKHAPEH